MEKKPKQPKAERPEFTDRQIDAAPEDRQVLSGRERRQVFFFPKETPPAAVEAASEEEARRLLEANQNPRVR